MKFTRWRRRADPLSPWIDERSDLAALARTPEVDGDELLKLLAAAEGSTVPSEMSEAEAAGIFDSVRARIQGPHVTRALWPRVVAAAAALLAIAGVIAVHTAGVTTVKHASAPRELNVKTVRFEMVSSGKHSRLEIAVYRVGGSNAR
jgi:hypothetical protein